MWKTYSSIMDIQFNSQLSSKDNGTKEKRARFFKIVGALLFLSDTTINGLALSVILSNVSGIMFPYYQFTFSAWNTVGSQLVWAIVMKGVKKEKHTQDSEMGLIKRGKSRRQKEIEQRPRRGMYPGSICSCKRLLRTFLDIMAFLLVCQNWPGLSSPNNGILKFEVVAIIYKSVDYMYRLAVFPKISEGPATPAFPHGSNGQALSCIVTFSYR